MNFWEMAYQWGWATIEQLRLVVTLGELSEEDFERITGIPFNEEEETAGE